MTCPGCELLKNAHVPMKCILHRQETWIDREVRNALQIKKDLCKNPYFLRDDWEMTKTMPYKQRHLEN